MNDDIVTANFIKKKKVCSKEQVICTVIQLRKEPWGGHSVLWMVPSFHYAADDKIFKMPSNLVMKYS